jgi:glycosyltransferase involved in cell wall biosynthesis
MRVIHVVQLYWPVQSGAARYFVEIGERLVAEGHHVTVLATDAHDLEHLWAPGKRRVEPATEWRNGIEIIRLPIRRLPGPSLIYPILRRLMVELARIPGTSPLLRRMAQITPQQPTLPAFLAQAGHFDLIHGTNITLDFALWPLLRYAQQQKIPFCMTPFIHLGVPGDNQIVRYYAMRHQIDLLRASQRVITMTEQESAYVAKRGVPAAQICQIGVGVTPSEVLGGDGERFRNDYGIQGPLVLYIGVLARDKGAIDTVEALRCLWAQGSTATLVLIGAPMQHFNAYYATLSDEIKRRIKRFDYAADSLKRDALAAADLLTLPSRTDSFGIVFLEAWCYRLPVIGAYAGGIPGVITDDQDGLLVPYGDPSALAVAIQRVLTDHALAQRLGAAGNTKMQQRYTWDRVYHVVRNVYYDLVGE